MATHYNPDIDGMIGQIILDKLICNGETIKMFFSNTDYVNPEKRELLRRKNVKKIIFIDTAPGEQMEKELEEIGIQIEVYDHHPWERYKGQTATSLLLNSLNVLDEEKKEILITWSENSDFKGAAGDYCNVASAIQVMNESFNPEEVYKWTKTMIEAELKSKKEKQEKTRKLFLTYLISYIKEYPKIALFQRMKERIERVGKLKDGTERFEILEDNMNLIVRSAPILEIFGEETMKNWILQAFTGMRKNQEEFYKALKKVKKYSEIMKGKSIVIFCDGFDKRNTNKAARHYVNKKFNDDFNKINNENKIVPVVVQINTQNKGFQIYSNGDNNLIRKIVKALRAEILKFRGEKIPSDWSVLEQEGILLGTEPLYYVKGYYGIILWGSLTRPDVIEVPIEILNNIEKIMAICIDPECYIHKCRETGQCNMSCEIFPWRLPRCWRIREKIRN